MATSTLITDYLGEGLASARPASLSIAGSALGLYVATDTGALSIWYSGAWHVAGLLPSIASGDLIANTGTGSAVPIGVSLTSLIDLALGNTQGDIIFRSGTSWAVLAPGTSGNVLATQGTGANPHWISPPASGVTSVVAGVGLNGGTITSTGTIDINFGTIVATAAQGNDARIVGAEQTANKGVPSGYASLDGSGKVPTAQLPASAVGGLTYQGTWDANTNTPTLASGTGTTGFYYVVATAGTTTIDGISVWGIGDWISFDGTKWDKLDGSANPVSSVAGRQGAVVLSTTDISGLNGIASQTAPASGPIYSNGTVLVTMALGTNLSFSSGTLALASTPTLSGLIINANTTTAQAGPTGTELQIVGADGVTSRILLDAYNAPATWTTRRAGGTNAVPTALPINTAIATYNAIGHQGTAYSAGHVYMTAVTGEAWTPTAQGHYITWSYAANGGTVVSEGMRLSTTGALLVGQTTDDGVNKVQINGGVVINGTNPLIVNGNSVVPAGPTGTQVQVVGAPGAASRFLLDAFGANPIYTARRAQGTAAAPTAVTSGLPLLRFDGIGHDGTAYSSVAPVQVSLRAAENWSGTAHGTQINFTVTKNGGTIVADAMILQNDGVLNVGSIVTSGTTDLVQVGGGMRATGTITAGAADLSLRTIPFSMVGIPGGGQKMTVTLTQAGSLLANGGTPQSYVPTNPTATNTLVLNTIHLGTITAQGTISISTSGVVTFPTFSAATLAAGDSVQIVNQATADVTFKDACLSLQYRVT